MDVSPICIGCLGFGDPSRGHPASSLDEKTSLMLMRHAVEAEKEPAGAKQNEGTAESDRKIVDAEKAVAMERGTGPAQIALAWLSQPGRCPRRL